MRKGPHTGGPLIGLHGLSVPGVRTLNIGRFLTGHKTP